MPILQCYVDERTLAALNDYAAKSGREVEELAEAAIADAALRSERDEPAALAEAGHG